MFNDVRAAAPAAPAAHPAIARLRRPVGIKLTLRRALIWAIASAVFAAIAIDRWPLAAVIAVIVVAALIAFVAIRGSVVTERIGARLRFFRRRRRIRAGIPGRVIDVDGCGVREGDGFELVSAIELTADLAETRLRDGRAFAAETVPLDLLATMMTQYGLNVDIDVVSSGRRVPPGPAYRASYSQGVRFYSAVAQRSTWLILRLNTERNLAGIVRRGPSRTAGPKALMAATRRLEQRLQERLIRARVLPASELEQLHSVMTFGTDPTSAVENWTNLDRDSSFTTTYLVDPSNLSTERLERWWGLDSDSTSVVLQLRTATTHAPVEISGLVRYETAVPIADSIDDALVPMPGQQLAAARATLPGGASSILSLPSTDVAERTGVEIPVGPAGPVWGFSGADALALPLYDASPVPKTLQVEFATDLVMLQAVLLRSVGAGASVQVHTARPAQWQNLAVTLADPSRFGIAPPNARSVADITVFDGVEAGSIPARTMLTVRGKGGGPRRSNVDLTVEQIGPSKVAVWLGRRPPIEVVLNPTEEELRYCDVTTAAQMAPEPIVRHARPTGPPRLAHAAIPQVPQPALPQSVPPAQSSAAFPELPPGPSDPSNPPHSAPPRHSAPAHHPAAQAPLGEQQPQGPTAPYPVSPPRETQTPPRHSRTGAPPPTAPMHRPNRPVRPLPDAPYERSSGAPRKVAGNRWVRSNQTPDLDRGADRSGRQPITPSNAPRWTPNGDQPPADEPPTSC